MSRRRDDRGAVAVMFGLMVVLLFSFAALAVDLGQAFVRKAEVQKGSDMAALAGSIGSDLPANGTSGTCSYGNKANGSDQAVKDVAAYLNRNGYTGVTPEQLTDCSVKSNGEVFYGNPTRTGADAWSLVFNKNQLTLVSPPKNVSFGFAGVMPGVATSIDVVGQSTVEIRSPRVEALPLYSYSGCDYGPQTLSQPNDGHSVSTLQLYADGPSYYTTPTLATVTPDFYPAGTAAGTLQPITINGANLGGVAEVGFFESGNSTTGPAPITTTAFGKTASTITLADLPDQTRGVTGVQNFWYIRVRATVGSGDWSKVVNNDGSLAAPRLTIGDPPLTCGQGSSAGNFGTLLFSKSGYNGADSVGAANVALGLDHSLAIYPSASRLSDGTCNSGQTTSVLWPAEGTNCVDTNPGMSAQVATGGFLGSGSSAPTCSYTPCGLLKRPSTTKCGPGGTAATTSINGQSYNNDTLTCFFTNSTVKVGDIDNASYTGPAVLSSDIYSSPRFGWVPVLAVQPGSGGSNKYQIVDIRPCFVTDQLADAQKGDAPSASNGITMSGSSVQSVQVVFISPNALPVPTLVTGTVTYTGSGVKVPLLVN